MKNIGDIDDFLTEENCECYEIDYNGFKSWYEKKETQRGTVPSEETVITYVNKLRDYERLCGEPIVTQNNLRIACEKALEGTSPRTANLLVNAMNAYLAYIDRLDWKLSLTKVKSQQFIDDILSMADYEFVLAKAKAMGKTNIWLYCKIAGTTGMRLSEMLQVKREHIEHGCVDIYGKGAKRRRIYFPTLMRNEVLQVLDEKKIKSGKIFNVCKGAIQHGLERFGAECELPKGLLHPHGLRHFYAKEFVRKHQNIALLADLLGHNNLETTRIYLKFTSKEQAEIVNEVVTW